MAGKKYDVEADITVNPKDSGRRVQELHRRVSDLGNQIRGTTTLTGGLIGKVVALGGAYVGFSALTSVFRSATSSAIQYQSELQGTKISLATVLSAVQGIDYATAAKTGDNVFTQLQDDAIKSVATSKELFSVYQSILGPIANAGFGLDKVRKLTNDSVSAASVLGVDFQQASRDMGQMLRGAAGVDVKLFSMLKSTGAITESTEDWNKKLTSAQRVEKLEAALGKFAPAASRFQTSWAGVTSSFKDITQNLRSKAVGPVFDVLTKAIGRINDSMMANRDRLSVQLAAVGTKVAAKLDVMFLRAENGVRYIANHWDEIYERIARVVHAVQTMAPMLAKAAVAWQAVSVARSVVGTGLQLAGGAMQAGSVLGAAFGGAGAAGVATGSAAVATGGFGAAGAGGAVATEAAAASISLAAVGTVLLAVGGAALVAQEQWQNLMTIFSVATDGFGGELMALAKTIWVAVVPVLKMFAQGPMLAISAAFTVLMPVLQATVVGLRLVFETFGKITTAIYDELKPGFDFMWDAIAGLAKRIKDLFGGAFDLLGSPAQQSAQRGMSKPYDMRNDQWTPSLNREGFGMFPENAYNPATPAARSTTVNDFRGSKIEVKQDFREADPDRVLVQMFDALGKAAEQRTQSPYLPSLAGS